MFLSNIMRRKVNWIGYILRRNFLHRDDRKMQFFDDLRKRRIYWELKEKAADRDSWKRQLIT